jgi:hypothetical protein
MKGVAVVHIGCSCQNCQVFARHDGDWKTQRE